MTPPTKFDLMRRNRVAAAVRMAREAADREYQQLRAEARAAGWDHDSQLTESEHLLKPHLARLPRRWRWNPFRASGRAFGRDNPET